VGENLSLTAVFVFVDLSDASLERKYPAGDGGNRSANNDSSNAGVEESAENSEDKDAGDEGEGGTVKRSIFGSGSSVRKRP